MGNNPIRLKSEFNSLTSREIILTARNVSPNRIHSLSKTPWRVYGMLPKAPIRTGYMISS